MNRQIKFRGKDYNTGEWVYGDLLHPITSCRIVNYTEVEEDGVKHADYHYYDVDPDTTGQFTGLHDRTGKEIYEGDVVRYTEANDRIAIKQVYFIVGAFSPLTEIIWMGDAEYEVLGNIHDSKIKSNMINKQKPIRFINDCGCIVDESELAKAILWYQNTPTASIKHIYMHGAYPAVSIHKEKLHIHRLLMLYWNNGIIPDGKQVHHRNGNKKDASRNNLTLIDAGIHQSLHNKGKSISQSTKRCDY